MKKVQPEQLKKLADNFLTWARTAPTERERQDLLGMAHTCTQAASDTESSSEERGRRAQRNMTSL
jgi:hypothetical protein